jgi:hypothetical protein
LISHCRELSNSLVVVPATAFVSSDSFLIETWAAEAVVAPERPVRVDDDVALSVLEGHLEATLLRAALARAVAARLGRLHNLVAERVSYLKLVLACRVQYWNLMP